jgi:hypothetical protein
MAVLRLGRFGTGPVGTGEMLTSHAALADACRSMRDRTRPVHGKDVADPCGGRHSRRLAWPPPPSQQPRHGIGREPAARRAGVNGPGWPARYEIRVDSVLDNRWADWFGSL